MARLSCLMHSRHHLEGNMEQTENKRVVAGVDVSKDELVVRVSGDGKLYRFENSPEKIREFVKLAENLDVTLVVCEHTGRHECLLLEALWEGEVPVHCAHPRAVHNFAKALRTNAKSDPLDAATLMEYGLRMDLNPTPRPAPELALLRELTARRLDFNEMLVKEQNRLSAPGVSRVIQSSIKAHIRQMRASVKALEKQTQTLIEKYPSLKKPIQRLDEEPGVGIVSAAAIYSSMPELGTLTRQTAAALAGLAPYTRESGKYFGQRKISGGRKEVRTALYMVALSVIRMKNHPLSIVYRRLKEAGKRGAVALIAVMRKLIIRFNTILRELKAQEQIHAV